MLRPLSALRPLAAMAQMLEISQPYMKTCELEGGCADTAASSCFGAIQAVLVKGGCKLHYPDVHGGVAPSMADAVSHEEPQHLHS